MSEVQLMEKLVHTILSVILLVCMSPSAVAHYSEKSAERIPPPQQLDFSRVWVFSAGIHKFDDNYLHAGKEAVVGEDVDLMRVFLGRGVPADHIVFLRDEEATRDNCRNGLKQLISRAAPGDFLLFFMHSHGGKGVICTYQQGEAWRFDELIDEIETGFRGSRACVCIAACHSGSFIDALAKTQRRVSYFVVTSVSPDKNAWTIATADFEACIADVFAGSACPDLNRDGVITFDELGKYVARDQSTLFGSQPDYAAANGFDENAIISLAGERRGRFQCCLVSTEGDFRGRILRQDGDRLLLRTRKYPGRLIWTSVERVRVLDGD